MDPALDAALAAREAIIFGAVELLLPDRTVRLLDGAGRVVFDAKEFLGHDDEFGVLSAIDDLEDGDDSQAPGLSISLLPASDTAAAKLSSVALQGSTVLVWLGAIDRVTGQPIGEPLLIRNCLLDVPKLTGVTTRLLEYDCTSIFDDFFLSDDGATLSDGFHQYLWPGELGCSFVSYVTQQIYWGMEEPSGVH
jgi:hypothetical protein